MTEFRADDARAEDKDSPKNLKILSIYLPEIQYNGSDCAQHDIARQIVDSLIDDKTVVPSLSKCELVMLQYVYDNSR